MNIEFNAVVEALGWSLLHLLWQGTVIALLLGGILQLLRKNSPQARYLASGVSFLLVLIAFGVTLGLHWPERVLGDEEIAEAALVEEATTPIVAVPEPKADPVVPSSPEGSTLPNLMSPSPTPMSPGTDPKAGVVTASAPVEAAPSKVEVAEEEGVVAASYREDIQGTLPWVVAVWALGVLILSGRLLAGWLRLRSWRRSAEEVRDEIVRSRFGQLCERMSVRVGVKLKASSRVAVPLVVGWLKPVILLPAQVVTRLSDDQLMAILAHELAHVRRNDFLINFLQNVAETLLFFHPAVWWISAQLRKEREHCCDDIALKEAGGAVDYARALTALEEWRAAPCPSVAANGGPLLARVHRLLGLVPARSGNGLPLFAGCVLVLGVLLMGLSSMGDAAPPEPKGPEVRGLSLVGIATLEAPPKGGPGSGRRVYTLSLGTEKDAPVLHYVTQIKEAKHSATQFFVQLGDTTYGPIAGEPGQKLKLHEVYQERWETMKSSKVASELREVMGHPKEDLLRALCGAIPQHAWDGGDPETMIVSPADSVRERLLQERRQKSGKMSENTVASVEHALTFLDGLSRRRFEARMVEIPDKKYRSGKPLNELDVAVTWNDADEAGLRFGIGGVKEGGALYRAQRIPATFYLRNDSQKTIKLSSSGMFGGGLRAWLVDEKGKKHYQPLPRTGPLFLDRYKIEPGHFVALNTMPLAISVKPGNYRIETEHRIGQWLGPVRHARRHDPRLFPGLNEWRGTIKSVPLNLQVRAYEAVELTPKSPPIEYQTGVREATKVRMSVLEYARVQFYQDRVTVTHGYRLNPRTYIVWDKEPSSTWRPEAGQYRAAYEVGAARRLWLIDGDHIICKVMTEKLEEEGRWSFADWYGELGGMSAGVRKVLKLPAKGSQARRPVEEGKPLEAFKESGQIFWGKQNERGLTLGVAGIPIGYAGKLLPTPFKLGHKIPIELFVMNNGPKPVSFQTSGPGNHDLRGSMTTNAGRVNQLVNVAARKPLPHRYLVGPNQVVKLSNSGLRTILDASDAATVIPMLPSWFQVSSGNHRFELGLEVGIEDQHGAGKIREREILDSWSFLLNIEPLEIRVGRPGQEIEAAYRYTLRLEKGALIVDGLQGANLGRWESAGPDFLAATYVGASRVWVKDEAGVTLLEIRDKLVEAAKWSRDNLSGSLGGMPVGVRKALRLPGRTVSVMPDEGVPSKFLDLSQLAAIHDKDKLPAEVTSGRRFIMPIRTDGEGPKMVYPYGKPHFYLQSDKITYGPISGNPFEVLDLVPVLKEQVQLLEEPKKSSRLWELCHSKDDVLLAAGYSIIPDIKDYKMRGILACIAGELHSRPLSPTAAQGKKIIGLIKKQQLEEIGPEGKKTFDHGVVVEEGAYHRGHPIEKLPQGIVWGKPNEVGLRLGLLGLQTGKPIALGRMLPLRIFLRNDHEKVVKCNPTGMWGMGVGLKFTDQEGQRYELVSEFSARGSEPRVALAKGRYYECEFNPVQLIAAGPDGSATTLQFESRALVLRPDLYKAEFSYTMGVYDRAVDGKGTGYKYGLPAAGEWRGTLKGAPMNVEFVAPPVEIAAEGKEVIYYDLHKVAFGKDKIDLIHRVNWPVRKRIIGEEYDKVSGEWTGTPWGEVSDTWKPKGKFRAAMERGATRIWIVDEAAISLVDYHHDFRLMGQWKLAEAQGALGGMPIGVRKALKLPAVEEKREAAKLPAFRAGEGSEKFKGFLSSVRKKMGWAEDALVPTSWGEVKGGLQAGLVMDVAVKRGEKVSGWILIKNLEGKARDIEVVYSWNTLKLVAQGPDGAKRRSEDWFMKLLGADAILKAHLEPGEHLEFPIYEIVISDQEKAKAPFVRVKPEDSDVRIHFDMSRVLGRNVGVERIQTGMRPVLLLQNEKRVKRVTNIPFRKGRHSLTEHIDLLIAPKKVGENLSDHTLIVEWKGVRDEPAASREIKVPRGSTPFLVCVGQSLYLEENPTFSDRMLGLRKIEFPDMGELKESAWSAKELAILNAPIGFQPRPAVKGVDSEVYLYFNRARCCHGSRLFALWARGKGTDLRPPILTSSHLAAVEVKGEKGQQELELQLTAEGVKVLQTQRKERPKDEWRVFLEQMEVKGVAYGEKSLTLEGPFDEESARVIRQHLELAIEKAKS